MADASPLMSFPATATSPLRFESTTTPSSGIRKLGAFFIYVVEDFVFLAESPNGSIAYRKCVMSSSISGLRKGDS